jgi:hypothetical protein
MAAAGGLRIVLLIILLPIAILIMLVLVPLVVLSIQNRRDFTDTAAARNRRLYTQSKSMCAVRSCPSLPVRPIVSTNV